MIRDIITIDEDLCTGCGECIPGCPEGALQIIDNKARLVSDLSCDGLGACIGHCPTGAMKIEKREAEPYDEKAVMENIVKAGENTILAHLKHLKDHGETGFLNEALEYLKENGIENPMDKNTEKKPEIPVLGGCPGSRAMSFNEKSSNTSSSSEEVPSELRQWPVQMHLVSPEAPYFKNSDVLIAADCTAFSLGGFHGKLLKGKSLGIACPKLDDGLDTYYEKIKTMIDRSSINTLTVAIMEVPCCGGLLAIAQKAVNDADRKIPLKKIVVGIQGEIINESWV